MSLEFGFEVVKTFPKILATEENATAFTMELPNAFSADTVRLMALIMQRNVTSEHLTKMHNVKLFTCIVICPCVHACTERDICRIMTLFFFSVTVENINFLLISQLHSLERKTYQSLPQVILNFMLTTKTFQWTIGLCSLHDTGAFTETGGYVFIARILLQGASYRCLCC